MGGGVSGFSLEKHTFVSTQDTPKAVQKIQWLEKIVWVKVFNILKM